jgi:dTDP-4-dehydrorhamnose reductase
MRILITGATGMLGLDVSGAAADAGHDVVALSRAELDITDPRALTAAFARLRPEVVINCAAWTDVDGAERAEPAAFAVNGGGAGFVADAASACDAWTIHVSSDYVFDGLKRSPYLESDPVGPRSAYGRTKLAGEAEVAEAARASHTIVRSSWLFGPGGKCFPTTILRLAHERDRLTVVDDQVGCPTFTGHLARALVDLAEDPLAGVVHVAAAGECSWHAFATEIVRVAGLDCEVLPGKTADLGRAAPRPAYSVMRTERVDSVPQLPDWHDGLAAFIAARSGVLSR